MTKNVPQWFLDCLNDEPIVPPKVQWDFSGKGISIPEKSTETIYEPTGYVTCTHCIHCIPESYKVMITSHNGKPIQKRTPSGEPVYDIHCTEFNRRVSPWFTCHKSKCLKDS